MAPKKSGPTTAVGMGRIHRLPAGRPRATYGGKTSGSDRARLASLSDLGATVQDFGRAPASGVERAFGPLLGGPKAKPPVTPPAPGGTPAPPPVSGGVKPGAGSKDKGGVPATPAHPKPPSVLPPKSKPRPPTKPRPPVKPRPPSKPPAKPPVRPRPRPPGVGASASGAAKPLPIKRPGPSRRL